MSDKSYIEELTCNDGCSNSSFKNSQAILSYKICIIVVNKEIRSSKKVWKI